MTMQTTVSIPGMHCASCSALIRDISSEFPDIKSVSVDMEGKKVTIEHSDTFNIARWRQEIENLGEEYRVHTSF